MNFLINYFLNGKERLINIEIKEKLVFIKIY